MYICPTCGRTFGKEEGIQKHFLSCWREQHPGHKSKAAPRGEDIIISDTPNSVFDFFNSFKEH